MLWVKTLKNEIHLAFECDNKWYDQEGNEIVNVFVVSDTIKGLDINYMVFDIIWRNNYGTERNTNIRDIRR